MTLLHYSDKYHSDCARSVVSCQMCTSSTRVINVVRNGLIKVQFHILPTVLLREITIDFSDVRRLQPEVVNQSQA